MSGFFNYFPTQLYSNTATTNIIAKIKFDDSVSKNLATFYPYTLLEGQRADQVAEAYYEDPYYDWVVYLSNGIIDPVHEWPKSQNEFDSFIEAKYGSITNAINQTAYYAVNYGSDDRVLSQSEYTALATNVKKYWAPILGYSEDVINYQRKELDLICETNMIMSLTGTFGGLQENDVIQQSASVRGTVGYSNSTVAVIKHVTGTWANATPVTYTANGATANATITSSQVLNYTIPQDEFVYWQSVSKYDSEFLLNEQRKHIKLLGTQYIDAIERDMKNLLQPK